MTYKELVIVFVFALSATLIPRARTYYLTTNPEGHSLVLLAGRPFAITCNLNRTYSYITNMIWKNPLGEPVNEGNITVQKIKDAALKLVFSTPTSKDSGMYTCSCKFETRDVFVIRSQTEEKAVSIDFYNPDLRFQSSFKNVFVEEGSNLFVSCSAIGDGIMTYTWHNQYQEVISSNSSSQVYAQNQQNKSILKIRNISNIEAGSYTCTASNKNSVARKEYEILICNSADVNKCNSTPYVRHVQVVNLTENSVQFGISVSGPASSIIVRYSTRYPSTIYEKEWKRGDTYEVRGLIPGDSYTFLFKAIPLDNDFGQTTDDDVWSKAQEITMLPPKPDVVIHALSGGSVQIERNQKNDDEKVDKYKLKYFPIALDGNGKWFPTSCPITIDIPACSNVDYTVSGLSSNTYYELQLQGHTASGYGEPYKQKIYIQ